MSIIPKGKEPTNVKRRIDTLFPKLDSAYPDKIIISLAKDHKKWDETAREISKQLGYESKNDFLTAYGYKIEKSLGGRPSNDYMAIIDELKKRYPNGSKFIGLKDLARANPDLSPKFKTLTNKANELFGMTFAKYLVNEGILIEPKKESKPIISAEEKAKRRTDEYKAQVDEVVTELKKRYTDFVNAPGTIERLRLENSDLPIHYLTYWIPKAFKVDAIKYLEQEGVINLNNKQSDVVKRKILIAQQNKESIPKNEIDFQGRTFATTGLGYLQNNKIADIVRSQGGFLRNCVSKNTDYLIKNSRIPEEFVTPKFESAKLWISSGVDIRIFEYEEFMNLVNQISLDNLPEFIINEGVLIRYTGKKQSVVIPDEVVEISRNAFDGCNYIVSLTIPLSIKQLKSSAFMNKTHLESVNLPEQLSEIPKFIFSDCVLLTSITLPKNVAIIEEGAFRGCEALTSLTIPDGVKKIGFGAFQWCTSLKLLEIPESVTEIGEYAFYQCHKLSISTPAGSYAEKYAIKNKISLISKSNIPKLPTDKKLLPLFENNKCFTSKKNLFSSTYYSYRLRTKNKEVLNAYLSYIEFGEFSENFDIEKDVDDAEIEIYQQNNEYIAEIAYKNSTIIMDLPNLYDDVECMYEYCKGMVEEVGAYPFKFSFQMSSRHGDYMHMGDCTFDGKTICYFDNASVDCMEPSDSNAKAEYINKKFVNEEKYFNTIMPDL